MTRPGRLPVSVLAAAVWIAPALFATVDNLAQRRLAGEPMPPLHQVLFSGGDWLVYAILTPPIFAVAVAGRWSGRTPAAASSCTSLLPCCFVLRGR